MELTAEEIRVLGCLIEKEATTPDHYPLSTNALTNACNQKTSREPVVAFPERVVSETMLLIRQAGLARTITSGRSQKHRHILDEVLDVGPEQLAVLAIMMLRGPQTPGELRTRTERYVGFDSVERVDAVLAGLAGREEPLVVDLGRAPGQSQNRWAHLLGGEASLGDPGSWSGNGGDVDNAAEATAAGPTLAERVRDLEERLAALESALGLGDGTPD